MGDAELRQLEMVLDDYIASRSLRPGRIEISGLMRTHVGMGSATAIRLGALEAISALNGFEPPRPEIIQASRRGGTSGIGVTSYFEGGLILDLGKRTDGTDFMPTSAAEARSAPLALPPLRVPDWPVLLCVPLGIESKTQEEEVEFFKRATPISAAASYEASYIALFQLYASVAEKDRDAFCRAVSDMQMTSWKAAERALYGPALTELEGRLMDLGADCVGMSSLGPMLFCLGSADALASIGRAQSELGVETYLTTFSNHGRSFL